MFVASWLRSVFTTQDPTTYKSAIDGNFAVLERVSAMFAPSQQATANMTILLRAGSIMDNGSLVEIAAQTTTVITAPSSNSRIDRIVTDQRTGVYSIVTGTPGVSPVAPAIPAGKSPNCQVLLTSASTSITNSMITDERVFGSVSQAVLATTVALLASLASPALTGAPTTPTPAQFDNSAVIPNTSWVNSVGLRSSGAANYATSAAMTNADIGRFAYYYSASNGTLTLPPIAGVSIGGIVAISNLGGGNTGCIIAAGTATGIDAQGIIGATSTTLNTGDSLVLCNINGTYWAQVAGFSTNATTQAQFDISTKIATTSFAMGIGLRSAGSSGYGASATLTAADFGRWSYYLGSSGTLTLPAVNSGAAGSCICISNISGAGVVCTIQQHAAEIIYAQGFQGVTSIQLFPGESIILMTDTATWFQVAGNKNSGIATAGTNYAYIPAPAAPTPASVTTTTATKLREFRIPRTGSYTIYMAITSASGGWIDGQIYKNGVAVGTLRTTNTSGSWTENLSFNAGDLCQFYGWEISTSLSGTITGMVGENMPQITLQTL